MPDLQYDTECMRDCARVYREKAYKLKEIKGDLEKKIDDLKSQYWRSSAGEAFMELYQDSWADNVEKYADMLEEIASMLEEAATEYDEISNYTKRTLYGISI